MDKDQVFKLSLEYLKSSKDIGSMSVAEYFAEFNLVHDELSKLENDKKTKAINDAVNKWANN